MSRYFSKLFSRSNLEKAAPESIVNRSGRLFREKGLAKQDWIES
jgi:hypothetical protein